MKKNIKSLFAFRTLIVVLCVICGAVPAWAHGIHYARVTVTASPTGQGKVYMTTDANKVPSSEDWKLTMSEDWNCDDGIGPSEEDNRTYYVHAQAESGYHFEKWSSNSSGTDSKSTDAKYAYSTKASSENSGSPSQNNIYAIFAANPTYTATFLTTENGSYTYQYGSSGAVTVTTEQSVTTNLNFALTATPDAGYELYGWYTESGGIKTYFDYSSYSLPSYALPGNVRIGVDFMPIGTPLFQIKGAAAVYTDLNAAVTACGGATKTIVLINNGTLPAGDYTIPTNVTLLIPFDAAYTCYTTTPALTSNSFLTPEVYRTLTMSPGATLTVNGAISVSAKLSSRSGYGPNGAPSGKYGAIKMLSEENTQSTITLNNGAKLYGWGYVYGEGAVEALSGSTVYEGFVIMDWRGGNNTLDMYNKRSTYKVFPFNQYYIQNIEVPLTIHKGATESVYSSIYGDGDDYPLSITMVGESNGLFRLTGIGAKLTKWYDPLYDRQHYELEGAAAINAISFTAFGMTVSSSEYVLPITNNMDITVRSGATVSIAEDVCIMPDASVTVEQGATMNIASGKNVYVYDKNAYTNAGTYTTSQSGYPSAGPGRYAAGAYVRRISYSPSWAALSDREIRRLQNMSSAHFQVNGTLNVSGKLYTTEGGADIFSAADGAVVNLATGAGTANKTYQVDHENYDAYYYTIPVTSALLHHADGTYQATAGNAAGTTWTYAHGHWGWCIIWRLEDGTELKRMYQPAQPDADWLSSNAPATGRAAEGTCSYVFNGWNTVTNTSQQEIEVTAGYIKTCDDYYDILWKSEDGTETYETDENVGKGETTRYNGAAPVKADDETNGFTYTFDGWTTMPNGGGTKYTIGETPAATGNATYYAHFAATEVAATVTANGVVSYYPSIADAFTAANTSDYTPTIQVWRDATNTPALTYTAKNHCTLDLNGHTISGTNMPLLTINDEGYTFTVTDRTETKEGKLAGTSGVSQAFVVHLVFGVFRLEAGTVYGRYTASTVMAGVYAESNREVIMTGGTIQVDANSGTGYGIFAQGKGTINGGTIRVESSAKAAYAVQAQGSNGNVTVTDGKFYAAGKTTVTCVLAKGSASLTVNGGYYNTAANLETYKAATCRVYSLPSTKLPYRYTVTEKTPLVASVTINSVTTEYSSFADAWSAVNSASAASTLKLLDDVDLTTGLEYTNASKNCTLDLNGHIISGSATPLLKIAQNGITFTITDLSEAKEGRIECNTNVSGPKWAVEVSQSTLRFEGGTIYAKNTHAGDLFIGIYSGASGVIEISGGNIHTVTTAANPAYGVLTFGTATISGGSFKAESSAAGYAVEARNSKSNVTITGGKFSASGTSAACVHTEGSGASLTLQGGYYNTNTNLAPNCATNYHVFPNSDASYPYKVAEGYTLSWTTDGDALTGDYTSGLIESGATIVAPATPTKTGYTFAGWSPSFTGTMPAVNTTYTATWAVASVTISGTTTLYTTFLPAWTAVNGASAASTLTLLQDVTVTTELTYNNSNNKNCTLNLNGHTLTSNTSQQSPLQINNTNITFTITDGTENKSGKLSMNTSSSSAIFGVYVKYGAFQLEGGTIEVNSGSAATHGVTVHYGTFTMNGGTIHVKATNGKDGRGIYANSTTIINGGTVHVEAAGTACGVRRDGGTVTINGGKFTIYGSTESFINYTDAADSKLIIKGGYYTINSRLGTYVSAPYHVFDLTSGAEFDEGYRYKVAEGYTVTFNANGHGSAPEAQLIEMSARASEPTAPTAEGYTFGGWYKEAACTNEWDFDSDEVTQATNLFAKWTMNTYTINYELNGGSVASENPTNYTVESGAITLNNPTKANYVFAGWTGTDLASATMNVTISAGSTGDRSYTATWTPAVASVTVNEVTTYYTTFDDAWSAVNSATAASTIQLLQNVSVASYKTYNNSNNKNCTLDLNGHTLTGTGQTVLHPNKSGTTFTLTDRSTDHDGKIIALSTSVSASYGVFVEKGTFVMEAGTIDGLFSINTLQGVRVGASGSFRMDGGTIHVKTTNGKEADGIYANGATTINGGTIEVEADGNGYGIYYNDNTTTVNAGYFYLTASGSAYVTNQASANVNVVITGGKYNTDAQLETCVSAPYHVFGLTSGAEFDEGYRYKVAEGYTVTFKNEDETLQSGLWENGTTPIYSGESPVKAATAQYTYTFDDWSPAIAPVTADVIYTAQFSSTVNTYTVTWKDADGTTLETDENVPYGATPAYNGATPAKATDSEYAYTFETWSPTVSAVTGDATYTATYTTTPVVASVTVNSTTTYYTTFDAAWTAATGAGSASTLTLLDDVAGLSSTRTYSASHDLMLDLNGHTLSGAGTSLFQISCTGYTFTVTDGSANHNGKLLFTTAESSTSSFHCVIVNNGTFVLEAGTIEATSSTVSIGAVQVTGGTFTMNENGAIHAKYTGNVSGKNSRLVHANGGTTTINGGTIHLESTKDGIGVVYGSGNVTFNGGKFKIVVSGTAAVTNKKSAQTNLNIRGGYYSANDNTYFTPHVKTPYHIFANADAEYPQKVAEGYTVTFNNYDDTSLQSGVWEKGTTPTYGGETPTKPADAQYTYTFNGWNPAVGAITDNTEYTATYSTTPVVASVTISGATSYYTTFGGTGSAWEAANSATSPVTIKLLQDVTATSILGYDNSSTQNCTLDLNGHTITSTQAALLNPKTAGITFTLTDNSENQNGRLLSNATDASTAYGVLISAGTFVLDAGTIEAHLKANTSQGVRVANGASLTMNGGTIEVETTNNKSGCGVFANTTATATINGGTIRMRAAAKGYAVNAAGTTTITGGRFYATGTSAACVHIDGSGASLTLQGGYYNIDANLATHTSAPYEVQETTAADKEAVGSEYNYKVVERIETGAYLDIIDWTASTLTINANGWTASGWPYTINDVEYAKEARAADRTLTIPYSGEAGTELRIEVQDKDDNIVSLHRYTIPFIGTTSGTSASSTIYVNSGTLTIDASETPTIAALYIRPEASVNVTNGTLTVGKLVMRTLPWQAAAISGDFEAEEVWYTRIAPNKRTISGPGGEITYESASYYQFALPRNCTAQLKDIQVSNAANTPYGNTWLLKRYDEPSRAANGVGADNWVALDNTETIQGGVGYEMFSNSNYYREFYFPLGAVSSASLGNTTAVRYDLGAAGEKHAGWNIVASPLMSVYDNSDADPEEGMKVSMLLTDGSYDQGVPEYIYPAIPFSYQASEGQTVISFEGSSIVAAAPRRSMEEESVRKQWLHLDIKNANGVGDQTSILTHPTRYKETYKTGIDVAKQSFEASRALIYSTHTYGEMAFAGVSDELLKRGVALTVYSPLAQNLAISMRDNNWLERMRYVWLIDHETGAYTDLLWEPYTFEAVPGTTANRFTIQGVFRTPQVTTDVENGVNGENGARKVIINDKMYIILNGRMYDATGKIVK